MSKRIREHLRSNVVGYVAIFLFAVGGTAYATHPGGVNTISSEDIINGEVKSVDVGTGEVRTVDIGPGEVNSSDIADDAVNQAKILSGAVRSDEIANNAVASAEVVDNSLTGSDVANGSLTDADTSGLVPYGDILWAVVNSDGSLSRASNGTTTSTLEALGSGDYEVDFGNGNLDPCASVAQISDSGIGFGESPGQAATAQGVHHRREDVRQRRRRGRPGVHGPCPLSRGIRGRRSRQGRPLAEGPERR
jgi:hypothetical protein